jgi:hypothetical protein
MKKLNKYGEKTLTSCPAYVKRQRDGNFQMIHEHNHDGEELLEVKVRVYKKVKCKALRQKFDSAKDIVEEVLLNEYEKESGGFPVISIDNLTRIANRQREKSRPTHPTDLFFKVKNDHIPPNFYRGEVIVHSAKGNRRHLIFATDLQLQLLRKARRWFADGTFDASKKPFSQLFSLHAFIRKGDSVKQVPLFFALMSSKRAKDYKAVLDTLLNLLPVEPNVEEFVSDFEQAIWLAVRQSFNGRVKMSGCYFHWSQAVWRKLVDIGLGPAYRKKCSETRKICRRLMCLPFLPARKIVRVFNKLKQSAVGKVITLCQYIYRTWISPLTAKWQPKTWSVFMKAVRTNNDAEGWHNRLNQKIRVAHPW